MIYQCLYQRETIEDCLDIPYRTWYIQPELDSTCSVAYRYSDSWVVLPIKRVEYRANTGINSGQRPEAQQRLLEAWYTANHCPINYILRFNRRSTLPILA